MLASRAGLSRAVPHEHVLHYDAFDKPRLVPGTETQKHLHYILHNCRQWETLTFQREDIYVK